MTLLRLLCAVLLVGWALPARADDISATGRGVVRVVTIAIEGDEVVGFGHGSGFAVAPHRIVTNAHVVALAGHAPGSVVIGVVPSEGARSYEGKVIAIDTARDLALIQFSGASLPAAALYTGPVEEGAAVTALGYPGNVDLATARSAADYIHPLSPIRSEGVFSGLRALSGVQVLLHSAGIARGNSGGPLLDPCGRVIGVNSAITRGEDGDSSFGFAIADSELATFLRGASQPYAAVGSPCTSIADTLRQDADADAHATATADAARREGDARAVVAREIAMARAAAQAARGRENYMALAAVALVLGALAIGGGGLLEVRERRRAAMGAAAAGGVFIVAAVIIFLVRPSGGVELPVPAPSPLPPAAAAHGKLTCSIVPGRSRVTVSSTADVAIDWGAAGCMNKRTQYAEDGGRWARILVPAEEQTVSVLEFDPATRVYADTRYLLSAGQMDAARKIRAQVTVKACSPDPAARATLATQQAAIRAALPPYPNEKIVYACRAAG